MVSEDKASTVREGREADVEGEGHRELSYTGIINHFLGHSSLTRSQNASFHRTYESAQIIVISFCGQLARSLLIAVPR